MAANNDSGLSLMEKLIRYLRLGTEGNFFLPGKNKAFQRFGNVFTILVEAGQGPEAVECIKRVNAEKSYFKREPLLYFLALATHSSNLPTKSAAYAILNEVCENPYDLFVYLKHLKDLCQFTKGWGGGLRKAVSTWYHSRDPVVIADFVTRYKSVGRWHHKDVFRLAHIKPQNDSLGFIIATVCKSLTAAKEEFKDPSDDVKKVITYLETIETVKHSTDALQVAMTIEERNLNKEHIPAVMLSSKEVWNSLLLNMSVKDTLINLPSLARRAFLTKQPAGSKVDEVVAQIEAKVLDKINDASAVEKEKINPVFIYIAIRNYVRVFAKQEKHESHHKLGAGSNKRGLPNDASTQTEQSAKKKKKKKKKKGGDAEEERPEVKKEESASDKAKQNNPQLFQALFKCFNVAVEKNIPVTNKRYLIAVKASVSEIGKGIRGIPSISALEVMALMALLYKKKESTVDLGFFTASLTPMKFPSELENIIQEIGQMAAPVPNLACDPAAPITWALEKKKSYDVFLLMSDGTETHGEVSAADKLNEYRDKMKLPNTRFVLNGLCAPRLDFAQTDGMFNIGGFDSTVPRIINMFVENKLDVCS